MENPNFDIRKVESWEIKSFFKRYHGYGSVGITSTYAFAVYEEGKIVAAFTWQPPIIGAAKSVSRDCYFGVLALSRMVAVDKAERKLKHISKPLKYQMFRMIDRTRWPILITYSDESMGHNGFVYECSKFKRTLRSEAIAYTDKDGARVSSYSSGENKNMDGYQRKIIFIQRWENCIVKKENCLRFMEKFGWERVPTGKKYRSGTWAFRIEKRDESRREHL